MDRTEAMPLKKRFSIMGWAGTAIIALQLVGGVVLGIAIALWGGMVLSGGGAIGEVEALIETAIEFGTVFIVLFACYPVAFLILRAVPVEDIPVARIGGWGVFARGLCYVALASALGELLNCGIEFVSLNAFGISVADASANVALSSQHPIMILYACILGPAAEEFIFRKQLIDRMRVAGDKMAILISALMFALMHGNLIQCGSAFLAGLALGWVYVRTGKLRYVIIPHIANNVVALGFNTVASSSLQAHASWDPGLAYIPDAFEQNPVIGIALALFAVAALVGLALLIARRREVFFELYEGNAFVGYEKGQCVRNKGMIIYIIVCLLLIVGTLTSGVLAQL